MEYSVYRLPFPVYHKMCLSTFYVTLCKQILQNYKVTHKNVDY